MAEIKPVHVDEKGIARILGWAVKTVQKKRSMGEGPPYYKLPRLIRYNVEEVLEWMQQHRVIPTPKPKNPDERRGRPRKYPLIVNGKVIKPAAVGPMAKKANKEALAQAGK